MEKKLLFGGVIGFTIALIYSLIFAQGSFYLWQLRLSDALFLPTQPKEQIVIIGIDDASLQAIGRWPWNRQVHADLLAILGERPAVIGYDVTFPEPSTDQDDQALREAFENAADVILPIEARSIDVQHDVVVVDNLLQSIDGFRTVTEQGIVNTIADEDSVTRSIPLRMKTANGEQITHFSYDLAQAFSKTNERTISVSDIPTENGLMKINFVGEPATFPTYSFVDVLNGSVPLDTFTDKIVLIGATAQNLRDSQITPVSFGIPMNGVEIHANGVETILEERYLINESTATSIITLLIIGTVSGVILAALGIVSGLVVQVILTIIYTMYAFVSFDIGIIRSLLFPGLTLLTVYLAIAIYKYFVEHNQRRFLRKAFAYYVPKTVLEEIIRKPEQLTLGGEQKEMTVLFADIEGFTYLSEEMSPKDVADMLNYYLTRVSKRVFEHNGTIDKFIGDAVVAFWNAPLTDEEHALNACKAAIGMRMEVKSVRQELEDRGMKQFYIRIGISTGEMLVGNMGSEMRFNYTVLGDNVNLASRLESINKIYGTRIIISSRTYELVQKHVSARHIDTVVLKGKTKPERIYELISAEEPTEQYRKIIQTYEEALNAYTHGQFVEAKAGFETFLALCPDDDAAGLMIERCVSFIASPPENWQGVYFATEK